MRMTCTVSRDPIPIKDHRLLRAGDQAFCLGDLFEQAELGSSEILGVTVSPGELIIRTPEAAARVDAENKTCQTVIQLIQLMSGSEQDREHLYEKTIHLEWKEPNIPEFWGVRYKVIEGTIGRLVGQNNEGLFVLCSINQDPSVISIRPCDLVIAAKIEINLDELPADAPDATANT